MNRVIRIKILSTCTHRLRILCEQLTTFCARPRGRGHLLGKYAQKIVRWTVDKRRGIAWFTIMQMKGKSKQALTQDWGGGRYSEESMYLRLYSDAYPCHRHDRVETQIPLELRIFWDITHFRDTIDTITPPSSNLTTSE